MIRYLVEQEVKGVAFPEPFARTIKHLAGPGVLGNTKVWLGIDEIEPHNSSTPHVHEHQEEIFFFISGRGKVRVDEDEIEIGAGYCVFIPMGSTHEVANDGDEILRFIAVVSPPFTSDGFGSSHGIK